MGKTLLSLAVVLSLSGGSFSPADDSKDATAAELKKLAGLWEVEKVTLAGRDFPKGDPAVRYEIKDSLMMNVGTKTVWMLEIDAAKQPKRMTQTQAELKDKSAVEKQDGQVNMCVYSLEGDSLRVVFTRKFDDPKADFPKSLEPKDGEPVVVMLFKRAKK